MNNELEKRLSEINTEDMIFIVFIVIIILSYVANEYEKKYFINGDDNDRLRYYYLQIFVFLIVVIINIYYVLSSYKELVNLSCNVSYKKYKYAYLDLVAGIFALIATSIILYIVITDKDIEAEISI